MSNFWTVRFLKTESELNFGFPHIPTNPLQITELYVLKIEFSASNLVQRQTTHPACVWKTKRRQNGRGLGHVT